MKYSLDDIEIIPATLTDIRHRSECNPFNEDGKLPLIASPMNCVINEHNYTTFNEQLINTVIPRGVDYKTRLSLMTKTFVAMSMDEFDSFYNEYKKLAEPHYICVDVANGHMRALVEMCAAAKEKFGNNLVLMTGNIANPLTYDEYAKAGIDFVRCSVGSGAACLTSCNTACHAAMGSLIIDCNYRKRSIITSIKARGMGSIYKSVPLIVADGGFDNYGKIIKALALGADFVMIGKLFAQTEEACGEIVEGMLDDRKYRAYYGMSTKRAQKETGREKLVTSEGIELAVPIQYTLASWTENFIDYLRSAMSYTNSKTLTEFQFSKYNIVSSTEFKNYFK